MKKINEKDKLIIYDIYNLGLLYLMQKGNIYINK